jgi:hypothetical protein
MASSERLNKFADISNSSLVALHASSTPGSESIYLSRPFPSGLIPNLMRLRIDGGILVRDSGTLE